MARSDSPSLRNHYPHFVARGVLLLVPLSLALTTSACGRRKICKPAFAAELGYTDAGLGTDRGLDRARECRRGKYRARDFERDYWQGWDDYIDDTCREEVAAELGEEDGRRGDLEQTGLDELDVCLDDPRNLPDGVSPKRIQSAYDEAFAGAFCNAKRARAVARRHAERMRGEPVRWGELCPGAEGQTLQAEYDEILGAERARQCSERGFYRFGALDARVGRSVEEGLDRLEHCSPEDETRLMKAYRSGYRDERDERRVEEDRKERKELIKAVAKAGTRIGSRGGGRMGGGGGHGTIVRDGQRLSVSCHMDGSWAVVEIYNPGKFNVSFSETFFLTFYDENGKVVGSESENEHVSVWGGKSDSFKTMAPFRSDSCDVRI